MHTLAHAQLGIAGSASSGQVFVLAFKDTYWVSAILAGIAALVSPRSWPRRRLRVGGLLGEAFSDMFYLGETAPHPVAEAAF